MNSRQNKSLVLLLVALFASVFCAQGFAEEDGYSLPESIGIEWGMDIKSLDRMIQTDEKGPFFKARMLPADSYTMYTRSGDVMKFFEIEINAICYLFLDDKFVGYAVEKKIGSSPVELLREIRRVYGEGAQQPSRSVPLRRGALESRAGWDLPAFRIGYLRYRQDQEVAMFHPIPHNDESTP